MLDGTGEHRPAPDGRLVGFDEKRNRDNFHAITLDWDDLFVLGIGLLVFGAEKNRHVGAVDVGIEHPDARAELRQGQRDVHGTGRLADPALPGAHGENILDPRHLLLLRQAAGARDLRVPLDLRLGRARQGRQRRVDVVVDLVLERARRCRQHHTHADRRGIDDRHVLDHLELHHRAVELGILHRGQGLEDGLV